MSTANSLRIIAGKDTGTRIPLASPPVTIGRASDNRVVLPPETGASRHHAELAENDGRWSVSDLGSLNGTYVNGERIEWPRVLHPGDQIKIAGEVMVFEDGTSNSSTAANRTSAAAPTQPGRTEPPSAPSPRRW